jgi:hypothetical protein
VAEKTLQEQFDELTAHHEGVMASFHTLQVQLDASLQREVDLKAEHESALAAALAAQAQQLNAEHAAAIAELKEKTLLPAIRDLQARQAADLAAQHAAQLASL